MFRFGVKALRQFAQRLGEWPQYCSHILQIQHLRQEHPEIIEYIQRVLVESNVNPATTAPDNVMGAPSFDASSAGAAVPTLPGSPTRGPQATPSSSTGVASGAALSRTSSAMGASIAGAGAGSSASVLDSTHLVQHAPSPNVEEGVAFAINNLSPTNMADKAAEIMRLVDAEFYDWLSQYIVVKRASLEQNFHQLYVSLLDAFKSTEIEQRVLVETFSNIHILLNSEKTLASSSERTLLKNLGSWLGLITLARYAFYLFFFFLFIFSLLLPNFALFMS